jgi:nicotinamide-nucleotide amidase
LKSPRIEIVTIGDEILCGSIVDTNSAMMSEKLLEQDLEVWRMTSIGDDLAEIVAFLREVAARSHLAVVTGGLGPTEDDRTARAVTEAFDRPLTLHEPSLLHIRELFQRFGFEMTPNNERQAWMPRGSEVIPNPMGTAPGFAVDTGGCLLIFLPGVPRELERMLDETVIPMVSGRLRSGVRVVSRTLKVFGLTEAKMDQMVKGALDGLHGISLASLPRYPENRLRFTVRASTQEEAQATLQEAETRLRQRVGAWVYGVDGDELESAVESLLRKEGKTLAVAESCTGGLVTHRLTEVPGISHVLDRGLVTYSSRAKEELLGVPRDVLEADGAVSVESVEAMARGARDRAGASIGLAITGIAGPSGGTEKTPVGTVFIGLAEGDRIWSRHFVFRGGRSNVKALATTVALDWLRRYLLGEDPAAYGAPWR